MSAAETYWAEALFCSPLQQSADPSPAEIRAAVAERMDNLGIARCAGCMAQEFGEHPVQAAARMAWCLSVVRGAFAAENVH